jgi:endonuclease YncB( thermonuclease family)
VLAACGSATRTPAADASPTTTAERTPSAPAPTTTTTLSTTGVHRVSSVIDGDTFNIDDDTATVRVVGIDTPEHGQPCYELATGYLNSLIGRQAEWAAAPDLTLTAIPTKDDHDQYGRLLRSVAANGQVALTRSDGQVGYAAC